MADINRGRWTAEIEGDFVVFLIGARVNRRLSALRSIRDLGGRRGMKHMLEYLSEHPQNGLLGYEMGSPTIVQYWRSFEHLEAFAKDRDDPHLDAWRNYWRRVGNDDRTGIWHETFLVRAGVYEAVYVNATQGSRQGHRVDLARRIEHRTVSDQVGARRRVGRPSASKFIRGAAAHEPIHGRER